MLLLLSALKKADKEYTSESEKYRAWLTDNFQEELAKNQREIFRGGKQGFWDDASGTTQEAACDKLQLLYDSWYAQKRFKRDVIVG